MLKFFFLFSVLPILLSCNNSNTTIQDQKTDTSSKEVQTTRMEPCPGDANVRVPESEARPMIDHFNDLYRQVSSNPIDSLVPSVWIDSCIIIDLANYLNKHSTEYDGVRIYNCAYNKKHSSRPRQKYDNESSVVIQLTKPSTKGHETKFGAPFDFRKDCPAELEFRNFNIKDEEAKDLIKHFNKLYRKSKEEDLSEDADIKALSLGVWFKSCIIESLAEELKKNPSKLDGVLVYGAAYNKMISGIEGQFDANQSTFIMVAAKPSGKGGHEPAWNINKLTPAEYRKIFGDGYNHGGLCPTVCD